MKHRSKFLLELIEKSPIFWDKIVEKWSWKEMKLSNEFDFLINLNNLKPYFQTYGEYLSFKKWLIFSYKDNVVKKEGVLFFPLKIIIAEALFLINKTKIKDEKFYEKQRIANKKSYEKRKKIDSNF